VLDQLRTGELDVIIVASTPPTDDHLETLVLAEERLCLTVAANHRLANRESVYLRQAAAETFVGLTPQHGLRQVFDSLCEQAGFAPPLAFEGEEHATLRGPRWSRSGHRRAATRATSRPNARRNSPARPRGTSARTGGMAEGSPTGTSGAALHHVPHYLGTHGAPRRLNPPDALVFLNPSSTEEMMEELLPLDRLAVTRPDRSLSAPARHCVRGLGSCT
jgi:hypothetical protein